MKTRSLNQRLVLISLAVFLPMSMLIIYLLNSLVSSTNAYNEISKSVAYANIYVKDFKERIDYSMYLAVIGGKSMEELGDGETTVNGIVTVNPYEYINELEGACEELSDVATSEINRSKITRLEKSLESLRRCVAEIEENIQIQGMYDTNMELLDKNIYSLTSVIQVGIQDYIYLETKNFSQVRSELERKNHVIFQICIAVSIIAACTAGILTILASRSITRPIKKLCDMTGKVAKGDFTARTDMMSGDEIAVLTESFNDMTSEIGRLVEDIKMEQENLHFIETKLLQAQINPHFLYNTLDAIVWLAEQKKTVEVVEMVTALSDFFRTTLSEGHDYVSVREEELHIRSYLEIQQFRYQDILEYEIDIEKEIYDYIIPKLTLQPIVENALYHGIKNKRGMGKIYIRGYQEGEKLIFKIKDNGIGMDEQELSRLEEAISNRKGKESKNFGLSNVNQRIHHYYGTDYGIYFKSKKGEGTEVTIILQAKDIVTFS